ncbi:MAG: hypothetical protein AB7E95_06295 [Kiritimatiellales bacterium]
MTYFDACAHVRRWHTLHRALDATRTADDRADIAERIEVVRQALLDDGWGEPCLMLAEIEEVPDV